MSSMYGAAWCYLRRHPCDIALERFRSGLRHFARAQGAPHRYHETMTTAFVLLIASRLGDLAADTTWAGFASRNADLRGLATVDPEPLLPARDAGLRSGATDVRAAGSRGLARRPNGVRLPQSGRQSLTRKKAQSRPGMK